MCLLRAPFPGVFTSVEFTSAVASGAEETPAEERRLRFTLEARTIAGAGLAMKKPEAQEAGCLGSVCTVRCKLCQWCVYEVDGIVVYGLV
jgi:hypothetical protein|eukprot:evm.model.NODE_10672_length_49929_cov_32.751286.5